MRFVHKKSLTFIKLRGWGYIRYAGETEMEKKRVFSRVNNLIALRSAGVILKHCLTNQQLNLIKTLMGSWNFRKVMGQSKQLDLSQTIQRWAKHSTTVGNNKVLKQNTSGEETVLPTLLKRFLSILCLSVLQCKRSFTSYEVPEDTGNTR